MCNVCAACRDVAVLLVQPGGVQLKHLKRVDLDETRISIGVQQGPLNGLLTTTECHLLCIRRVLQVGQCVLAPTHRLREVLVWSPLV